MQSTLAKNEMQGPIVQPLNLAPQQLLSSKRFNEKTTIMRISKCLVWLILNEQCLVFFATGKSSTSKIHTTQILNVVICSYFELIWCHGTLFMTPNEKKWSTNTCGINIERISIASSNNIQNKIAIWNFLNVKQRQCCTLVFISTLQMSIFLPLTWWRSCKITLCGK